MVVEPPAAIVALDGVTVMAVSDGAEQVTTVEPDTCVFDGPGLEAVMVAVPCVPALGLQLTTPATTVAALLSDIQVAEEVRSCVVVPSE